MQTLANVQQDLDELNVLFVCKTYWSESATIGAIRISALYFDIWVTDVSEGTFRLAVSQCAVHTFSRVPHACDSMSFCISCLRNTRAFRCAAVNEQYWNLEKHPM